MTRAEHLRQAELWRALGRRLQARTAATDPQDWQLRDVGIAYREAKRHEQAAQVTELPTAA